MSGRQKSASIHAAVVAIGEAGVLIRGASGAGKSSLALGLVEAAAARGLFASLVADDRVLIQAQNGRLIARPHPAIAGRVERRGQGIGAVAHECAAVLRVVVDLAPALGSPAAPGRMPAAGTEVARVEGVDLPCLTLPTGLGAVESSRIALDFLLRAPGLPV